MHPLIRHLAAGWPNRVVLAGLLAGLLAGCTGDAPKPLQSHYRPKPLREVPAYLKDTIFERADIGNTGPLAVTSYGLVVNLRYSGDTRAPVPVREWMIKEMLRHGWGTFQVPGYKNYTPEMVLADKRTSIVMVGAYLPPGARKGQRMDVIVQAMPGNDTASLAGGTLYQCDLRVMGANPWNPGGAVKPVIKARGPVFINPAYALEVPKPMEASARTGARIGTILGGGICVADREIHLRLRTPQYNISRTIEAVINQRFQSEADKPRLDGKGMCAAEAQDEGYLNLYVPAKYKGNWQHFVGVVNHLYINMTPTMAAIKAQELANEAQKPGALLENISYALEGLGSGAVPAITSLLHDPRPEVVYAAARAGAFLLHSPSEDALIRIALQQGNPYRMNAIEALGELPYNAEISRAMAQCLESDESLVRIEAYKVLAKNLNDPRIPAPVISKTIGESFIVDLVDTKGKPMIYAARVGEPRLAIFGPRMSLKTPMKDIFSAFDQQLTISSAPSQPNLLSVFYRGEELQQPISALSRPLVGELAVRLGGGGDEKLRFGYGEVVAMLQSFIDSGKVSASLVLQDLPGVEDFPEFSQPGGGRPVGEAAKVSQAGANTTSAPAGNGSPQPRPN